MFFLDPLFTSSILQAWIPEGEKKSQVKKERTLIWEGV